MVSTLFEANISNGINAFIACSNEDLEGVEKIDEGREDVTCLDSCKIWNMHEMVSGVHVVNHHGFSQEEGGKLFSP